MCTNPFGLAPGGQPARVPPTSTFHPLPVSRSFHTSATLIEASHTLPRFGISFVDPVAARADRSVMLSHTTTYSSFCWEVDVYPCRSYANAPDVSSNES